MADAERSTLSVSPVVFCAMAAGKEAASLSAEALRVQADAAVDFLNASPTPFHAVAGAFHFAYRDSGLMCVRAVFRGA